ncbi:MAG: tellurite resistance TerB family protein [Rhodoplanes sp.]
MFDSKKLLDAIMSGGIGTPQSGLGDVVGQAPSDESAKREPIADRSFGSIVRQVLQEASSGLKDVAREVEARTGVGTKADEMLKQATGQGADDLWSQARELANRNQLAVGAAIAGLAGLLLGTGPGRTLATKTAKLGGLAVLGGLAYKALQNYRAGKPPMDLGNDVEPAPAESPFGDTPDQDQDQETAMLMVRAMIAAASADGVVDNAERSHIVGSLEKAGLDVAAAKFLDEEFAKPMSVEALVASVSTPAIATQVYSAARLAVNPDNPAERRFLEQLAAGLELEPGLVAHIDAAARSASPQI